MALFEVTGDAPPEGGEARALVAVDGVALRAALWRPETARGTVALLGGRTEFIEKYYETIRDLLARGFAVATMDWRGQGGSERQLADPLKGHIDDFALFERDFGVFERQVLRDMPRPWIGLSHSMGAGIVLRIAHEGRCPFDRLICTAPMIAIHGLAEPRALRWLAEALDGIGLGGAYAPGAGGRRAYLTKPFEGNVLTSDPVRYARMAAWARAHPALVLGGPTVGWIHAAFRLMREFAKPDYPRDITVPTLVVASGADRVVETRAIERFASRLRAGHLIVVDGARHEIMMERDVYRDLFFKAFDAFAGAFTSPLGELT